MENAEILKEAVREKYGQLARQGEGSCCGPTSCCGTGGTGVKEGGEGFVDFSEDYSKLEGYVPDADLGLGCGIPLDAADLKAGHKVLDLGSGAGNDVFIAARMVGETGLVIGVDMTPDMIKKSRENAARLGSGNVDFRLGEIEALPVESGSMDRVISNCVLNLVPEKEKAFLEIHRVLKPGGKFGISDVVLQGEFPEELKKAAELYVGCVSGAMPKPDYLETIRKAGFAEVSVLREKVISVPEDLLEAYLNPEQRAAYAKSGLKILSITVQGMKPDTTAKAPANPCCLPLEKGSQGAASGACCTPLA